MSQQSFGNLNGRDASDNNSQIPLKASMISRRDLLATEFGISAKFTLEVIADSTLTQHVFQQLNIGNRGKVPRFLNRKSLSCLASAEARQPDASQ